MDPGCAHWNKIGTPPGCCPSCRVRINQCTDPEEAAECEPEPNCLEYAEQLEEGECCLECVKERKRELSEYS